MYSSFVTDLFVFHLVAAFTLFVNVIALIVTVSNMVKHNNLFFICIVLMQYIIHIKI